MASPKKSSKKSLEPEIIPQSDDFLLGTHPRKTIGLYGHENTAKHIIEAFHSGRVPQALLLTGSQGIGKATFVYHLIRAIERKLHPHDIVFEDIYDTSQDAVYNRIACLGTGNLKILRPTYNDKTGKFYTTIRMEDLQPLKAFFNLKSHTDGYRYCVIDCVDDMVHGSGSVPNAILKTLEEPPERTIFFLIAHSEGNILPTIRSRCTHLRMIAPEKADFHKILSRLPHFSSLNFDAQDKIIQEAGGSVRRALIFSDPVWMSLLKGIKTCLLRSVSVEQAINIRKCREKFFCGTEASDILWIMRIIFNNAIAGFMKHTVMNTPSRQDIFFQGILFEKINDLFIQADDYNFTPSETFDVALSLLTHYHYQKEEWRKFSPFAEREGNI